MEKAPDKKIRVAVIVASLDILGGQAIAALRLLEGLAAAAPIDAELLPINPRLPGIFARLQRLKYLRTLVTFTYYVATLLLQLRRFDVLHVFSAANFSFLLAPAPAVILGRLYGKRVILHYHSGEAAAHLRDWRRTAIPVFKLADRVIVPSDFLVEVFASFGIRAEAIPNTVDLSRFGFRARFHETPTAAPVIFANRNFEAHYDVATTLRAFALIAKRLPQARLVIAGDGSERQQLHALARKLQLKNIEFVGAVAPSQMPAFYDGADIYLNSSVVDNMPLSLLEAFASGLAVVTTNAGGIPYLVKDERNGLLVECGDAAALAEGVLRLLDDGEAGQALARRLARQAREDCAAYEWAAVGGKWLALYEELAGRSSESGVWSLECAEDAEAARPQTLRAKG